MAVASGKQWRWHLLFFHTAIRLCRLSSVYVVFSSLHLPLSSLSSSRRQFRPHRVVCQSPLFVVSAIASPSPPSAVHAHTPTRMPLPLFRRWTRLPCPLGAVKTKKFFVQVPHLQYILHTEYAHAIASRCIVSRNRESPE